MKFSKDQEEFVEIIRREFPDAYGHKYVAVARYVGERLINLAKEYYNLSVAYHNRLMTDDELDRLECGIEHEFTHVCQEYLGGKASPFFADLELRISVPSGYSNRMGGGVWIPIE